jgi:hypothetical protein
MAHPLYIHTCIHNLSQSQVFVTGGFCVCVCGGEGGTTEQYRKKIIAMIQILRVTDFVPVDGANKLFLIIQTRNMFLLLFPMINVHETVIMSAAEADVYYRGLHMESRLHFYHYRSTLQRKRTTIV